MSGSFSCWNSLPILYYLAATSANDTLLTSMCNRKKILTSTVHSNVTQADAAISTGALLKRRIHRNGSLITNLRHGLSSYFQVV